MLKEGDVVSLSHGNRVLARFFDEENNHYYSTITIGGSFNNYAGDYIVYHIQKVQDAIMAYCVNVADDNLRLFFHLTKGFTTSNTELSPIGTAKATWAIEYTKED